MLFKSLSTSLLRWLEKIECRKRQESEFEGERIMEDKILYYKSIVQDVIEKAKRDGILIESYQVTTGNILLETGIGVCSIDHQDVEHIPTYNRLKE